MKDQLNLLLFSTSTVHGSGYLEYCTESIMQFFPNGGQIVFIPFARPSGISHDEYTAKAREKFERLGLKLVGIHEADDKTALIESSDGVFTGGGNTFLLLQQLYAHGLVHVLRNWLLQGKPYMGTSAGTNIAGQTIGTTNDMPIIYPPSFDAIGAVPFNINPHYIDPDPSSKHMGETRETRIREFHFLNVQPVVGLREGSWLEVRDRQYLVRGPMSARLFRQGKEPVEVGSGRDLSEFLKPGA